MGLGALYVIGEGVMGWVVEKDKVTDPVWRRALHLAAMLAMLAVLAGFVLATGLLMGLA
jgi:hypothetical protein